MFERLIPNLFLSQLLSVRYFRFRLSLSTDHTRSDFRAFINNTTVKRIAQYDYNSTGDSFMGTACTNVNFAEDMYIKRALKVTVHVCPLRKVLLLVGGMFLRIRIHNYE